jgi:hypothetical protein
MCAPFILEKVPDTPADHSGDCKKPRSKNPQKAYKMTVGIKPLLPRKRVDCITRVHFV